MNSVPDRPNHDRGCIYRYGAISETGKFNCRCRHKENPDALVPPWPEDKAHSQRWINESQL